jgi:hypothetical protein
MNFEEKKLSAGPPGRNGYGGRGPRISLRFTLGSFENTLGGVCQGACRAYSPRPSGALHLFGLLTQDFATLHPWAILAASLREDCIGRNGRGGVPSVSPGGFLAIASPLSLPEGGGENSRPWSFGSQPNMIKRRCASGPGLPEGATDSSPGWSAAQSWVSKPNKGSAPEGRCEYARQTPWQMPPSVFSKEPRVESAAADATLG